MTTSGRNSASFMILTSCAVVACVLLVLVTSAQTTIPNQSLTVTQDEQAERLQNAIGLVSRKSLNFGQVLLGETSLHKTISLKNTGTSDLVVTSVSISGDFALPLNHCAGPLKPGEDCKIEITFTPRVLGPANGTLTFADNDPNSPQTVSLRGEGSHTAPTKTTVVASPATVYAGQPITFIATVRSNGGGTIPDGGQVAFAWRDGLLGYGVLKAGVATLTTAVFPEEEGTEIISARFPGDASYMASEGVAPARIIKHKPTVTCSSSPNPSIYGQRVTKQGMVQSEGSVWGYMRIFGLCSYPKLRLYGGTATYTCRDMLARHARSYQIEAYYLGNKYNTPGSGFCTHVINPTETTTTIESSRNPSSVGQPVKLSVIVRAPYARAVDGSVTFMSGSDTLGTAQLVTGRGHIIVSSLPPGDNTITATYNPPNGDYLTSAASLTQSVQ